MQDDNEGSKINGSGSTFRDCAGKNEIDAFVQRLKETPGNAARVLELAIRTGMSTDDVIRMTWGEVDSPRKPLN